MAQLAKQWSYLSNFMGEGSKPEQLYIFVCFIWNRNIILYICINKSTLYFQYNFKFKIFQYGLMFVIYKFSSLP